MLGSKQARCPLPLYLYLKQEQLIPQVALLQDPLTEPSLKPPRAHCPHKHQSGPGCAWNGYVGHWYEKATESTDQGLISHVR